MHGLQIIDQLPISTVAMLAEHQARQALRAGRNGDEYEFSKHANWMYDILEKAKYPTLTTEEVVRRLGRAKSMVLQIERRIINLAL